MNVNIKYWRSVLRKAERELNAATGKSTLNAAARKLMMARQQLSALGVGSSAAAPEGASG